MFNVISITASIEEAEKFLIRAKDARVKVFEKGYTGVGNKVTGACRRSSMDLTRALADLRRSPYREK